MVGWSVKLLLHAQSCPRSPAMLIWSANLLKIQLFLTAENAALVMEMEQVSPRQNQHKDRLFSNTADQLICIVSTQFIEISQNLNQGVTLTEGILTWEHPQKLYHGFLLSIYFSLNTALSLGNLILFWAQLSTCFPEGTHATGFILFHLSNYDQLS